jgi:hypothetical protein
LIDAVATPRNRRDGLLAAAAFVVLVAGLVFIPRLVPAPVAVNISAAAARGYNTAAAFWTVLVWSVLVVAAFAWRASLRASHELIDGSNDVLARRSDAGALDWRELAAVFVLFALAYCPVFLARYAPYSEDVHFLTALGRMECAQRPYRDFGFLYGPLMIYLPWGWSRIFGAGLLPYFSFLALFEALQLAGLMAVLQRLVPSRRERYVVFLLLLPFVFNNLFGLNYSGVRWLLPTLALLLAALRPYDVAANLWCALLLGIHLTYSHEYATAGLLAIGGMYAATFWQGERRESLRAVLTVAIGSVLTWAVVAFALLGDTMPSYIGHARDIVGMMSSGHAAFPFYWTANSLALFGLLTIGCCVLGTRLASPGGFGATGRLLLGATLFTLVTLKSGLTRADVWHLDPDFLPLLFAFLLPFSARTLLPDATQRRIAFGLAAVAAATLTVGIAPMLSLHAASYVRGASDTLAGRPLRSGSPVVDRGFEGERSHPDADLLALGRYLRSNEFENRPVLFYGRAWAISARIGVCPTHYKLDDLMYTEFSVRETDYLNQHPETLVVMHRDEFGYVFGDRDDTSRHSRLVLTPTKQLGRWLSTVHYDSAETEARLQDEARARLTGDYVHAEYEPAATFGAYIVLARR